jgi:hypothetical protein
MMSMRSSSMLIGASLFSLVAVANRLGAQSAADGPILAARRVVATSTFKIFNSRGSVRVVGWDHDSVLVRGRVGRPGSFSAGGDTLGLKISVDDPLRGAPPPTSLVIFLPRRARATIKAVNADVDVSGVGGWIYTITGSTHVSGSISAMEIESMRGTVEVNSRTPWLRVRGGDGSVVIRGSPEDADVSTITGPLEISASGVVRGQFGSVSGAVHFRGPVASGGIYEFSNHSGETVLSLAPDVSAVLALSNVSGRIESDFAATRPASHTAQSLRVTLGHGDAQIIVRSFKGPIHVGPQR